MFGNVGAMDTELNENRLEAKGLHILGFILRWERRWCFLPGPSWGLWVDTMGRMKDEKVGLIEFSWTVMDERSVFERETKLFVQSGNSTDVGWTDSNDKLVVDSGFRKAVQWIDDNNLQAPGL